MLGMAGELHDSAETAQQDAPADAEKRRGCAWTLDSNSPLRGGESMSNIDTLRTTLLAMQETASTVVTELTSDRLTSAGRVSKSFIRQVNKVLLQVNIVVPSADLVLFDEDTEPHLVTYPKTVEIIQQIKLALKLLDTSPYSIKLGDTFDTTMPQAADTASRSEVFNMMKANAVSGPISKTRTILFMDVAGWSKLSAQEIYAYATTGLHTLSAELKDHDFINTWGDAIVATFESAKCAAENAWRIRDFFANSYPVSGVAPGLTCRVSLHVGEVFSCHNALRNGPDIFGEAVHVAARLEPVTMPGNIFCTKQVADMLSDIRGSAPRVWSIGQQNLAKDFGIVELYVVTGPNAIDPRPLIPQASKTASSTSHSENDYLPDLSASTRIKGWLNKLPKNRTGEAISLKEIEQECKLQPGQPYRLLPGLVPGGDGQWNIGDLTQHDVILNYKSRPPQSRPRSSFWLNKR